MGKSLTWEPQQLVLQYSAEAIGSKGKVCISDWVERILAGLKEPFCFCIVCNCKQGIVILTSGVLSELKREFKKGNTVVMCLYC